MSDGADADGDPLDPDALAADSEPWYYRAARAGEENLHRLIIVVILLLLVAVYFAPQIFITVHSGEVGVFYRRFAGGTQTDRVVGEGLRIIPPWDKLFIYNVRVQEQKHTMDVVTKEGLPVNLSFSIRYHPEIELVGLLQQQVGPDYADKIVIPEVESALRTAMAGVSMSEVYGAQRGLVQMIISDSLERVEQKFIRVDAIILLGATLPPKITSAIEDKLTQQEIAESYVFRIDLANKEAERLRIEANGLKAYQDILNTSLTPNILRFQGIEATKELAKSPNAKTVIIGDKDGLPLILGNEAK